MYAMLGLAYLKAPLIRDLIERELAKSPEKKAQEDLQKSMNELPTAGDENVVMAASVAVGWIALQLEDIGEENIEAAGYADKKILLDAGYEILRTTIGKNVGKEVKEVLIRCCVIWGS